ncbi:MAG TPA: alpha/beta hydrolase [Microthrixaceae bacterium]|nr:alpha/beta hydrolase [Microthrixaceae bacterium]
MRTESDRGRTRPGGIKLAATVVVGTVLVLFGGATSPGTASSATPQIGTASSMTQMSGPDSSGSDSPGSDSSGAESSGEALGEPSSQDLAYGPLPQQKLDIYLSEAPIRRGTIIYIHGGGFTTGDKNEISDTSSDLILSQRQNGFDVVSVNYRLASEAPYPAAFDDTSLAVSWVRGHGAEHGLHNERVIVVGHSAGGALAAMIGTRAGDATRFGTVPDVDGWVGVAAILDFNATGHMARDFAGDWGIEGAVERFVASPLTNLDPSDPPGFLIHGDHDNVVSVTQSDIFTIAAAANGSDVTYNRVDFDPQGRPASECLWHSPLCAANSAQFEAWLLDRSGSPTSRSGRV